MSDVGALRWQQGLANFEKAMARLTSACAQERYSALEQAGLAKLCSLSLALGWRVLPPNSVLRRAFEFGYLEERDTEVLLEVLRKSDFFNQVLDESVANEVVDRIKGRYAPSLKALLSRLQKERDAV